MGSPAQPSLTSGAPVTATSPAFHLGMVAAGLGLLLAVVLATALLAVDVGEALTRNTVRLSLAWYAASLLLMMRLPPSDRLNASRGDKLARWCWSWGMAIFLVHVAIALHFYDHWSHAHAVERTRQVSGSGAGIYVSYFFTWLWFLDVLWWWMRPDRRAARSVWIDRVLHAFMLFMVFNGMIVFEVGPIRWAGVALFAVLSAAWLSVRGLPKARWA